MMPADSDIADDFCFLALSHYYNFKNYLAAAAVVTSFNEQLVVIMIAALAAAAMLMAVAVKISMYDT